MSKEFIVVVLKAIGVLGIILGVSAVLLVVFG